MLRIHPALSSAQQPAQPPATSFGRTIQRVRIVDMATGEELRPLSLADFLRNLPPAVVRALNALPAPVQQALLGLPHRAQMALLELTEATQLQIIALLAGAGPAQPRPGVPALHGTGAAPGAMVPHGGGGPAGAARPAQPQGFPPDLLNFLLGRGKAPGWMRNVTVPGGPGRRASGLRALMGPQPTQFGPPLSPGLNLAAPPLAVALPLVPSPIPPPLAATPTERLLSDLERRGRPAYRPMADALSLIRQFQDSISTSCFPCCVCRWAGR